MLIDGISENLAFILKKVGTQRVSQIIFRMGFLYRRFL